MSLTRSFCAGVLGIISLLVFVSFAHAESVQWNTTFSTFKETLRRGPSDKNKQTWTISNLSANVTYNVQVTNADTGAVVACGSTVPGNTKLRFRFLSDNLTWFATGKYNDTPVGYWKGSEAPPVQCDAADMIGNHKHDGGGSTQVYGPFYGTTPEKSVTGLESFARCTGSATDKTCYAATGGTFTPTFVFASTQLGMYMRITSTDYLVPPDRWPRGTPSCQPFGHLDATTDFEGGATNEPHLPTTIPQQTIPCTIKVTPPTEPLPPEEEEPVPPPTAPTQPNISASGGAACVVGQPYSISMSSTDPEGDAVRFLVDWTGDAQVDQIVPGSGYVPSGTSLTTSRTFATEGSKSVQVRAEDEDGTLSAWATFTFSCAGSGEAGLEGNGNNNENNGNGGPNLPPSADLQIRAIPSLVRSGNTTKVNWSATNVQSCTVQGTNGDSWTGLSSPVGGQTSSAINGETRYTLTCRGVDGNTYQKQATVRVLPTWRER